MRGHKISFLTQVYHTHTTKGSTNIYTKIISSNLIGFMIPYGKVVFKLILQTFFLSKSYIVVIIEFIEFLIYKAHVLYVFQPLSSN